MKKLVIIAQPRTGSSMLVNALNARNDFNFYGELFARVKNMNYIEHPQDVQDQMIKRFIRNSYDLSGKKSVSDFLDYIYKIRKYKKFEYAGNFYHIGFKLLSPHLKRKFGQEIIDYVNCNDIYKILLYRENKIKQVLSARTNKVSGKIHIDDPAFFITRVKYLINEEKQLMETFEKGRYVKVSYEKLTNENDAEFVDLKFLWGMLGYIWDSRVPVPLRKYRPKRVQDNISNFETLYKHVESKEPGMIKWLN